MGQYVTYQTTLAFSCRVQSHLCYHGRNRFWSIRWQYFGRPNLMKCSHVSGREERCNTIDSHAIRFGPELRRSQDSCDTVLGHYICSHARRPEEPDIELTTTIDPRGIRLSSIELSFKWNSPSLSAVQPSVLRRSVQSRVICYSLFNVPLMFTSITFDASVASTKSP